MYSLIFTTMYKDGLILPLFSLAILRDISGPSGYLALGGVSPVNFVQDFNSTPILITNIEGYTKTYDFYTININGVVLDGITVPGSRRKDPVHRRFRNHLELLPNRCCRRCQCCIRASRSVLRWRRSLYCRLQGQGSKRGHQDQWYDFLDQSS